MNTDLYRATHWDRDPILRALTMVLALWEAREPGATFTLHGDPVRITHYSPCRRNVHFAHAHSAGRAGWAPIYAFNVWTKKP